MKKTLLILSAFFILIGVPLPTQAAAAMWTDDWPPDMESGPVYLNRGDHFSYTHSLIEAGFDPDQDVVCWYDLAIGIEDDSYTDGWEIAWINLPGIFSDTIIEVDHSDVNIGISLAGVLSLNIDGTLGVEITSLLGDFLLVDSTLRAYGHDSMPIPIPAPALLLGTGLIGLLGLRRRRVSA
jgi:hypothetical protein